MHTMKDMEPLFGLLDRQVRAADGLLDILAREQQALLKMDVQGLVALSRSKMAEAERISRLDAQLAERIAVRLGGNQAAASDREINLSALAGTLKDPELRARIEQCRRALVEKRRRIHDANHINQRLVEDTIDYLGGAMELLTGVGLQPGYDPGNRRRQDRGPAFISREV